MSQTRAAARAEASRRGRNRFIVIVILVVVVIALVLGGGIALAHSTGETIAEAHLLSQLAGTRVGWLVSISLGLDWLFSPTIAFIIGVVAVIAIFLVSRSWVTVLHFALLVLGTWLSSEVIKVLVHRPRPAARIADTLVPNPDPDSYPSGHVCFAVAIGLAFLVLVMQSRVRVLVAILAILLALVTASSRLYLGIHYPTDVLASLVYAVAAFVGIETLWRQWSGGIFRRKQADPVG